MKTVHPSLRTMILCHAMMAVLAGAVLLTYMYATGTGVMVMGVGSLTFESMPSLSTDFIPAEKITAFFVRLFPSIG